MNLTKTEYIRYLQCRKCLWITKHRPDLKEDISIIQQEIFDQGYEVENLAWQLFDKGYELKGRLEDLPVMTRKKIEEGHEVLYQATANPKHLLAKADIFIKNKETGKWDIYEVKSTTEVKEEHIFDLAFQKISFTRDGYDIGKTYLVYVNNKYIRSGNIDPKKFLITEDISDRVNDILNIVETDIPNALKIVELQEMPNIPIIKQCKKPYTCPYMEFCWANIPDYSVYDIKRINEKKLVTLLDMGAMDICDVPEDFPLSDKQKNQVDVAKMGKKMVDQKGINEIFNNLEYPLYFIDYESFAPAIPSYDGIKPYQQVCFQYSLHVIRERNGEVEHYEFLAKGRENPIPALLKSMRENIGDTGAVIVWNKAFEMTRNKEMGAMYPEYESFMESVNSRVFDLADIFSQQLYVHPDFKGSYSIKNVLPVLVPELSYKNLEIQEGGTASLTWFIMNFKDEMTEDEKEKTYNNLLKYCELDTLAMVEIMKKIA